MNFMIRTAIKALVFSLAFIALTAMAQDNNTAAAGSPGCGNDAAKFAVKTDKGQHLAQPEAGKALVYFIEDDSNFGSFPKPTTREGLDGKWVGATHGNSYLSFYIDPGVHHLCASWQSSVIHGQGHKTAVAHFTAEAGGIYYFEVKNTFLSSKTDMSLNPLDSDEGQLMASKYPYATSQQKK
jgi:hypothetical protein